MTFTVEVIRSLGVRASFGRLLPVIRCFSDGLFDAIGHLRIIQIPNARAAARSNPIPETRMNNGLSSWTRPQANREKREKFAL